MSAPRRRRAGAGHGRARATSRPGDGPRGGLRGRPSSWGSALVVAGNVSGLLGVGGGAFKVPIMNLLMGVPLKATIATSNLMIGVTAATGAAIFYGRGYLDPRYAVPAALGILVGARLGPRAAMRLTRAGPRASSKSCCSSSPWPWRSGAGGGARGVREPGHTLDPVERMVRRLLGIGIAVSWGSAGGSS